LLGERPKDRPDAGRLGSCDCHEVLESPAFRQQSKETPNRLVRV
jgi:hypothetical protein